MVMVTKIGNGRLRLTGQFDLAGADTQLLQRLLQTMAYNTNCQDFQDKHWVKWVVLAV